MRQVHPGAFVAQAVRAERRLHHLRGRDITHLSPKEMRSLRQEMQIVFQDPAESLNSRHTVGQILEEPFIIHGKGNAEQRRTWVQELLEKVGLPGSAVDRYPHEFSGGQRQRIGIARAIALKPKLLVCDEAVSALDVSVQSQIVNLLLNLQREMNLAIIFIAHDLSVVKHISDRIAVMYLGRIVELAEAQALYLAPRHPYTQALISAIPVPDPRRRSQRILLTGMCRPPSRRRVAATFTSAAPMQRICAAPARPPLRRAAGRGIRWPAISLARAGGGAVGKGDMMPAPAASRPASLQGGSEEAQ